MPNPIVSAQFQHLRYEIQAEGPDLAPLVLLHGFLGQGRNWGRVSRALSPIRSVLTYNQRGHGPPPHPESNYRLLDLVEDLLHLIDHLKYDRIDLLGHSMGGRVAIYFAAFYPDRVNRLILLDTSYELSKDALPFLEGIFQKITPPFATRQEAREALKKEFPDPLFSEFLYTNLKENSGGQIDWIVNQKGLKELLSDMVKADLKTHLQRITSPTLLIRGENSTHLTESAFTEMQRLIPNVKALTIKRAAHWVHVQNFEDLIRGVREFLKEGL